MGYWGPRWKKAQFQDSLVWCGWEINFSHDTIQLVSAKLTKLDALIKALLGSRRVLRKTIEQCIGLLIWATSIALRLRSCGPQQPTARRTRHRLKGGQPSEHP